MQRKRFLISVLLGSFAMLMSCNNRHTDTIRIATSANMHYTMKQLVAEFSLQSTIPCEIIVSSSGKLTALIKEGAPYDVFVAADMTYPQDFYDAGFALNTPKPYGYGKLILWTTSNVIEPTLGSLTTGSVTHIALANPRTAPYGIASMEVMQHYGIADQVEGKLVYGESVSQTNQFIMSQSAEIGFTALSVVMSPGSSDRGQWKAINESSYTPIAQGAILINRDNETKDQAKEFYTFLYSKEAKNILTKFGYSVDE